jgi:F-type H+-transporting ATPase subunit b
MQLVILIILLFLMKKFAWKPILNSLEERETGIESALASAENARKEMQNLQADNAKLVKEARAERDAIMKDARDVRDNMIAEAKEDAKEVTSKLIESAQASIQQEKQAALAEIKKSVAELSIGIAESVIKKELSNKADQLELVEGILKDVTLN